MVELEGYTSGTPEYDRELTHLKVEQCLRMQGVGTCSECGIYEHCELRVAHAFNRKYRRDDADR